MLFIQISFIVTFIYFIMSYSYMLLTPAFLLSNNSIIQFVKKLGQTLTTLILLHGFKMEPYLNNNDIGKKMNMNPELVDVIICNHMSEIDWVIVLAYLEHFKIDSYNLVLRKGLIYWPGLGLIVYSNKDILLDRNWELDQKHLTKQINCIQPTGKKEVILIFPEGTRINNNKLILAQKYSKESNIPIFNNLLVPKFKGIYTIINVLASKQMLGRIWDITLIAPKYMRTSFDISDMMGSFFGPIYADIRELTLESNFQNLETFKLWFIKNWQIKDSIIDNYKEKSFEKLEYNTNYNHLIYITIISTISTLMLMNRFSRYYLMVSIIIAYVIIVFKL